MQTLLQRKNLVFIAVALIGALADQLSKAWVVANITLHTGEIHIIDGFLSFVHERNTGAAFSTFEGQQGLFLVFTVVAVVVLLDLQRRLRPESLYMSATLGLILSGAIGNFIDRARFAYVVDFIRVYTEWQPLRDWLVYESWFRTNTYPIFNIADSAILVGVALFMLHSLFGGEDEGLDDEPEAPSAADAEVAEP